MGQGSGIQPFWHQGAVLWKTVFPWTQLEGGLVIIQAHYIYHAATDLIGGGAQAVIRVMGSSCKYTWGLAHSPTAHLLSMAQRLGTPGLGLPSLSPSWEPTHIKCCRETQRSFQVSGYVRELFGLHQEWQVPFRISRENMGFLLRCCSEKGPHLTMTEEPRGFS